MGATVRASYYGASASEPAGVTAETGIKHNREDSQNGATGTIPVPTSAATNYGWFKNLALEVTVASGAATTISNRRIQLASAPPAGLSWWAKGTGTYTQPTSGNKPADGGANNNDLSGSGWTRLSGAGNTTSGDGTAAAAYQWDNTSVSSNATGRNGNFVQVVMGVNANTGTNAYTGGAGPTLPAAQLLYDEQ